MSGSLYYKGENGYRFESQSSSDMYACGFRSHSTDFTPQHTTIRKGDGLSLRCVVR